MRPILVMSLLLFLGISTKAANDGQAMYVGGTTDVKAGTIGKIAIRPVALNFEYSGGRLTIPFDRMESYAYSKQVAHHLGVLPAIAVSLVKRRHRKHFVRIAYRDGNNMPQTAVFEIPKQMPRVLMAVLQTHAPQGCKRQLSDACHQPD